MFTWILLIGDGVASAMVLIYPLLIVGSGLWFRRRVVAFMTFMVLVSYSVLVADSSLRRPELSVDVFQHLIFAASILILGTLVSLMVKRAVTMHRT